MKYFMQKTAILLTAVIGALSLAMPAYASLVSSLPGSTVYSFPTLNTTASTSFGLNITWSGSGVFGYDGVLGMGTNGQWNENSAQPLVTFAYTTRPGAMSFALGSNQVAQGIGGFINYCNSCGDSSLTLSAYDSSGKLLESHNISFQTPGGASNSNGYFEGIQESTANIAKITLYGGEYVAITNFSVEGLTTAPAQSSASVPAPETGVLMLFGLLGVMVGSAIRAKKVS